MFENPTKYTKSSIYKYSTAISTLWIRRNLTPEIIYDEKLSD